MMCASSGISAKRARSTGNQATPAMNTAFGRASTSASVATAATAAWRVQALAHNPSAHQAADCSISAKNAGRNATIDIFPDSAGAQEGSTRSGMRR